jgi:L-asparaginase II
MESGPVLVEVRRGSIVEARHRGAIVAVEPGGHIVASIGDDELITSTRSAIKPIQAVPLVASGAADRFQLTSRELAVICASHSGEPMHTYTVAKILARIGLDERALRCGAHPPYSQEVALRLERDHVPASQLHNNCSGKHAGMLMAAVHRGLSIDDYILPDHPVQRAILSTLERMAGLTQAPPVAIDGCSAPTFGIPLRSLALAFARLVNPWAAYRAERPSVSPEEAEAAKRIVAAMTAHPEMVGGTSGRLDTDLCRVVRGKLIGKIGAEAVYAVGVLPQQEFPHGLGIAFKMEDGSRRALDPAVVETLSQLGLLSESELAELQAYHRPTITNHNKLVVGEIVPVFNLVL